METPTVSTLPVPQPTPTLADPTAAQLAAISALSQAKGIPSDQIQLVSSAAVEWRDGCLGVVLPGVMCAQGLVPGYQITLSAYGSTYEYHTNQDGSSLLLVRSPFARIAVRLPDGSIQIVPIDLQNTLQETAPAAQSFLPSGGTARGTLYALNFAGTPTVTATDGSGTRILDFIKNPNYALAVWPGDASHSPLLAWGTYLNNETMQTELLVSSPDGTTIETLLSEKVEMPLYQLIAQRFSTDGKYLYFSKEPYGIGGYILYGGASSLYRIDLASKQIEEIIPLDRQAAQSPFICLDAFSMDYLRVADHCSPYVITVRSLDTGHSVTILPPAWSRTGAFWAAPASARTAAAWRLPAPRATRTPSKAGWQSPMAWAAAPA